MQGCDMCTDRMDFEQIAAHADNRAVQFECEIKCKIYSLDLDTKRALAMTEMHDDYRKIKLAFTIDSGCRILEIAASMEKCRLNRAVTLCLLCEDSQVQRFSRVEFLEKSINSSRGTRGAPTFMRCWNQPSVRFDEFVDWYNNRPHGSLNFEELETPEQAFWRKLQPEAIFGNW